MYIDNNLIKQTKLSNDEIVAALKERGYWAKNETLNIRSFVPEIIFKELFNLQ